MYVLTYDIIDPVFNSLWCDLFYSTNMLYGNKMSQFKFTNCMVGQYFFLHVDSFNIFTKCFYCFLFLLGWWRLSSLIILQFFINKHIWYRHILHWFIVFPELPSGESFCSICCLLYKSTSLYYIYLYIYTRTYIIVSRL